MRTSPVILGTAIVALGLGLAAGCDSTAKISKDSRSLEKLLVLESTPMRTVSNAGKETYVPVCDPGASGADGLLLNVVMKGIGESVGVSASESQDGDKSIRPGDTILQNPIYEADINPENFKFNLSCIEQILPDSKQCITSGDCDGGTSCPDRIKGYCTNSGVPYCISQVMNDNAKIAKISYQEVTPDRGEPIGVVILVDMSGSNSGLVHFNSPYYEDTMSDSLASIPEGSSYAQNGSDPGATRIGAVKELINSLNSSDKVMVISFNENKVDVVCKHPDIANPTTEEKLDACFSSNKDLVLGAEGGFSALDDIRNDSQGRTPLWSAVEMAYNFLKDHPKGKSVDYKHILVISDGPDTCSESADLNRCRKSCVAYQTLFEDVLTLVKTDAYEDRIPVHFVQFGAKGYPDRDARQMQIACETGGRYMFVNSLDFSAAKMEQTLSETLMNVRYTFGGFWRFAFKLPGVGNNNDLAKGWGFAVEGTGKISEAKLKEGESNFDFKVGNDNIDKRAAFKKECTADADCPAKETAGTCYDLTWFCDTEGGACKSVVEWHVNGDGEAACGKTKAAVKIQQKNLNNTVAGNTVEVALPDLTTLCCNGACVPPKPPQLPDDYKNSPSGTGLCYEDQGWIYDEEKDVWNFWITYWANKAGCNTHTANDAATKLKYADTTFKWPDDWDCQVKENCFKK